MSLRVGAAHFSHSISAASTMEPRHPFLFRVIICATIVHLGLVICGAVRFAPYPQNTRVGDALRCYQSYTGSDNAYGFFAPGVASAKRVVLHGYHAQQNVWVTRIEAPVGREIQLRLSTTAGLFSQEGHHEQLAASWAAWMFGEDLDASPVIVEIQAYAMPTMSEFRAGERPDWQVMEVFPFARRGGTKSAQ